MKNYVICIGRQYGSGGREIGEKLAQRLNVPCYDKLLLLKAAEESGIHISAVENSDERPINPGFFMGGNIFSDMTGIAQSFYSDSLSVFEAEKKVIENAAKESSCVIIGRCAQHILRDNENTRVISAFIYADDKERVHRVAERNDMTEKQAKSRIAKIDRMRRQYFDFYCDTKWGSKESYDIMLSSTHFGIDGCVDILEQSVKNSEL